MTKLILSLILAATASAVPITYTSGDGTIAGVLFDGTSGAFELPLNTDTFVTLWSVTAPAGPIVSTPGGTLPLTVNGVDYAYPVPTLAGAGTFIVIPVPFILDQFRIEGIGAPSWNLFIRRETPLLVPFGETRDSSYNFRLQTPEPASIGLSFLGLGLLLASSKLRRRIKS